MKLETYLNAMVGVTYCLERTPTKRQRQYNAFRDRILRTFEQYEIYHGFHMGDVMMIETITEKDKRLDVLRAEYDFLLDGSKELKAELEEKEYQIYLHEQALAHQDAKIAELEATVTELLVISAKERIARLEEA